MVIRRRNPDRIQRTAGSRNVNGGGADSVPPFFVAARSYLLTFSFICAQVDRTPRLKA
jgi:hypothetical protein